MTFYTKARSVHALLVIALLAVLVVFFSVIPQHGFVYPHLVNSGHAFVFGLGAYLLMMVFAKPQATKQVLLCALFAFALGVLVEIVQPFLGRQRSLVDAYYDLIGAIAATLWFTSFSDSLEKFTRTLFRLSAALIIISSLAYPAFRLYIQNAVDNRSPTVADFEAFWWSKIMWANNQADLTRVRAPKAWDNNSFVGQISFPARARYPGISFAYITPDWSQYDRLVFDIYSEQAQDLMIILRVHDSVHQNQYNDRYNRRLLVRPGLNAYEISLRDVRLSPKNREMNLKEIDDLMLFMAKPTDDVTLYLDNIHLIKAD